VKLHYEIYRFPSTTIIRPVAGPIKTFSKKLTCYRLSIGINLSARAKFIKEINDPE
jgi:hypothetical protein